MLIHYPLYDAYLHYDLIPSRQRQAISSPAIDNWMAPVGG